MSTRDRRTPTPQLALRVAAFGIIAFGVFAILFLRLWFLQILQGDQYLTQAAQNGARVVRVAAPRGAIVDRDGNSLVVNQVATVVTLQADAIPEQDRTTILDWGQRQGAWEASIAKRSDDLVRAAQERAQARETPKQKARRQREAKRMTPAQRREAASAIAKRRKRADAQAAKDLAPREPKPLRISRDATPTLVRQLEDVSKILKTSPAKLYDRVRQGTVKLPWAGVQLKTKNVNAAIRNYLLENPRKFPGITVSKEYVRHYPGGELASQIFGTVGQISKAQLGQSRNRGLQQGQLIGQGGLEQQYDQYLRGKDGEQRVEVNSQNRPTGQVRDVKPVQGNQLQLTLDENLERTGQYWMTQEIGRSLDDKTGYRAAGSYVAMDPRNGEVLAMGSYPSVDLNEITGTISSKRYNRLLGKKNGAPAVNRAIDGQYATGSTFKIVSAFAELASGFRTPTDVAPGGAYREFGDPPTRFYNAGKEDLGPADLVQSLRVSSDVYYYDVGDALYKMKNKPLQTWARLFGFGRDTGIDLPGEAAGVVPDSAWRAKRNEQELQCRKDRGVPNCFTVGDVNGTYRLGDNVNLAVGQGDLLASPLQLATAYSGLYQDPNAPINDTLSFPTPHLGKQVQNAKGVLLQQFDTKPPRKVRIGDPEWKKKVLEGLHAVTTDGTASGVFAGWDQSTYPVFGKTGTAERCQDSTCSDQAWFAAMVPDAERPIVVVATLESGGFGTTTAAPIVCKIIRKWYDQASTQAPCKAPASTAGQTE